MHFICPSALFPTPQDSTLDGPKKVCLTTRGAAKSSPASSVNKRTFSRRGENRALRTPLPIQTYPCYIERYHRGNVIFSHL